MKLLKRLFWGLVILLVLLAAAAAVVINPFGPSPLNSYQREGTLTVPGLSAPVTVYRDENGLAYIHAQNRDDLFFAQGFVTAQD
ncbi:MAG: penicillin acylase family protein, partial [Thermodesulfobacteriota bacterium]